MEFQVTAERACHRFWSCISRTQPQCQEDLMPCCWSVSLTAASSVLGGDEGGCWEVSTGHVKGWNGPEQVVAPMVVSTTTSYRPGWAAKIARANLRRPIVGPVPLPRESWKTPQHHHHQEPPIANRMQNSIHNILKPCLPFYLLMSFYTP